MNNSKQPYRETKKHYPLHTIDVSEDLKSNTLYLIIIIPYLKNNSEVDNEATQYWTGILLRN